MRRALMLFLCILSLFGLVGCKKSTTYTEPLTFYYMGTDFSYEAHSAAIQGETREGARLTSLESQLTLYLQGPDNSDLVSPFPAGLHLISAVQEEDTLYLTFSRQLSHLSGLDLTVACCCIARTCLELTDAVHVNIQAQDSLLGGERSLTLNAENMLLLDQVQQPQS